MAQWGPIGATGYQVSDEGDVMSRFGRMLRPSSVRVGRRSAPKWYRFVYIPGRGRVKVAVLVLEVFVGLKPSLKAEVRHLNDDSLDDRLENLAWGSHAENMIDRSANGYLAGRHLVPLPGEANPGAVLTDAAVVAIRKAAAVGVRQRELVARYGVSPSVISRIVNRKVWTHV